MYCHACTSVLVPIVHTVRVYVCIPDKGPASVHLLGGSACSVVMRASLVWLGGSSTIS